MTFTLHHPLDRRWMERRRRKGVQQVQAHLALPDLAPLAAAGGADIQGSTDLDIQAEMKDGTTTAAVKGRVAITGGMAPGSGADRQRRNNRSRSVDAWPGHHPVAPDGERQGVGRIGARQPVRSDRQRGLVRRPDRPGGRPTRPVGTSGREGPCQPASSTILRFKPTSAPISRRRATLRDISPPRWTRPGCPPHRTPRSAPNGTLLDAPLSLALTADKTGQTFKVDISQASWKSLHAGGSASLTPPARDPGRQPAHRPRPPRGPASRCWAGPSPGQASATLEFG